ncbi:Vms1/Ankzf1 family peptidyl-tRNA hydrolase [Actinomycetes bacterium KLBMP 9797]
MDLSFLRPLYDRPGPWASVYLDASREAEAAAEAVDLRWRGLRERLTEQGAPPETLAAVEREIADRPPAPGRYGLAVFAAGGEAVLTEYLSAPPRTGLARYGPLPHAMPLVAQRGEEIAWLRVLTDRTGADLTAVAAGGVPRTSTVEGHETHPIRKVSPGGWAQPRYQREAETTWQRNAGDVAAATTAVADQLAPEVLVIAGDVRARQLLLTQLPKRWQDRAVQTDAGSRARGADQHALDDVTIQAVAEVADRHTRAAIDRYGAQEGAGAGLAAAVAALRREQVAQLLIVDDPSSTDELWVGPSPHHLALSADELRELGVAEPVRVRADAALVRALAGTGAELILVGPDDAALPDGVGAVLRYTDPSTS